MSIVKRLLEKEMQFVATGNLEYNDYWVYDDYF